MEVVGSEIGQKMRSAIKAKLTELGCYVDDELPDYVMVMVANKRTRAQMEDDLQLFLGDNTELFVNWLHQVLKKLQEVTVTAPPTNTLESEKKNERSASKERKSKEKKLKNKVKKSDLKKAKKKDKDKTKSQKKKEEKKSHKKKKSKHHEMIRPNIPPLLMNIEKESEPSITDVFAGQILKNHGVLLETHVEEPKETKPAVLEVKRPILPIIDPATILSEPIVPEVETIANPSDSPVKGDQISEINQIEAKILGLKQKLVEQLDSMSEDEDFLNIRTEAEELMNDFAEDVFQEITQQTTASVATPPVPASKPKSPSLSPETLESPPPQPISQPEPSKNSPKDTLTVDILPQIELNLPKRPVRERLGVLETKKAPMVEKEAIKPTASPERYTPEREPEIKPAKTAKSRLGDPIETHSQKERKHSSDGSDKNDSKRLKSRGSVLESFVSRSTCASVVRVRPRPRVNAPANNLLLRAVADAHKSLLNIPPKIEPATHRVQQRALVLPMRRGRSVEKQKIVIQVAGSEALDDTADAISLGVSDSEDDKIFKLSTDRKEEYVPLPLTKKIQNTDYTPSRRNEGRTSSIKDDSIVIETINIHNPTVDKDKNTQFIVTMDGYHPNAFLAKKLQTEGLLEEDIQVKDKKTPKTDQPDSTKAEKSQETVEKNAKSKEIDTNNKEVSTKSKENGSKGKEVDPKSKEVDPKSKEVDPRSKEVDTNSKKEEIQMRLSNTSDESDTQVIIKTEKTAEKRKPVVEVPQESLPVKKRKSSPIVFDVDKKIDKDKLRKRTDSVGSDNHVVVTTNKDSHKYDSLPPLSTVAGSVATPAGERKPSAPAWCRAFPSCRYGAMCAFAHPRCKFAASCTRRACVYEHTFPPAPVSPAPVLASHVVPAANYKSISTVVPAMCKFYPGCANPTCHFYHPKPCRYGKHCANKLDCNFYHPDLPSKWYPA